MYNKILNYLKTNYSDRIIAENDMESFKDHINKKNVILLLKDIINDDNKLEEISKRSYTHALGFDKIVLMVDKSNPYKPELRLHLWYPEKNGVPLVESLHEHSFNFISTVLSGKLENQMFSLEDLNLEDNVLLEQYVRSLRNLTYKEKNFINEQIEILEALNLSTYGSDQFINMNMKALYEKDKAISLLNINEEDWNKLCMFEGHFVSNRISGEKKSYKHVFNKYVKLLPFKVIKINENEYYFHPYQKPHRLYYDNKVMNSTMLITTRILENPQGGSLQRPSYLEENEKGYEKIPLSFSLLKNKLINYINFLESKE